MTLTLEIPQELEAVLAAEAAILGLPLSEYAQRLLAVGRVPDAAPKTGAEVLAYWRREGVIGSRSDVTDSLEHARAIRRKAEKRSRVQ